MHVIYVEELRSRDARAPTSPWTVTPFAAVLATIGLSAGAVGGAVIGQALADADANSGEWAVKQMPPRVHEILAATGFLRFVEDNCDAIRWLPAAWDPWGRRWVGGLSYVSGGKRVVEVSFDGYDARAIASVLVHETAHHRRGGDLSSAASERYAREVTAQFLAAAQALDGVRTAQQAESW